MSNHSWNEPEKPPGYDYWSSPANEEQSRWPTRSSVKRGVVKGAKGVGYGAAFTAAGVFYAMAGIGFVALGVIAAFTLVAAVGWLFLSPFGRIILYFEGFQVIVGGAWVYLYGRKHAGEPNRTKIVF